MTRPTVAVVPRAAHARRARLLAALEQALGVRLVARNDGDWAGVDAVLRVGRGASAPVPLLEAEREDDGVPVEAPARIDLRAHPQLDRCLHRARLTDGHARPLVGSDHPGDVLATCDGRPAWVGGQPIERIFALPAELGEDEALRDRLAPGRNLALLAIVSFLRRIAGARGWQRPPLRAAIILDDPNLHWPSYGHVRYRDLARAAARDNYHVAMAMVPLDGWLVHPGAARTFRAAAARLSLLVHGNDHEGPELGRPASEAEARAVGLQALCRIEAFERRSGVAVSRVMAPPHERLSEPLMRVLAGCGFEAVSTTRPYPWIATQGHHWLERPAGEGPLAGWPVADVVAGVPVLLRQGLRHPLEDLVLRAFLGQALIPYGHHGDLAGGLERLAEIAAAINRLGDVRWGPLHELARAGVETRRDGSTLHVRAHALVADFDVPEGVSAVVPAEPVPDGAALVIGGRRIAVRGGEPLPVAGPARLRLATSRQSSPGALPPRRLRAVARRLASEGRDRVDPLLAAGLRRARA